MSITDDNTQALYAKTRLVSLAHIWYDSQSYDDGSVIWTKLSSHLHYYSIPSDYKKRARKALAACCMGNRSITEYINAFCKHLVCCANVQEQEAKFFFENNMSNWLAAHMYYPTIVLT